MGLRDDSEANAKIGGPWDYWAKQGAWKPERPLVDWDEEIRASYERPANRLLTLTLIAVVSCLLWSAIWGIVLYPLSSLLP